jgi:DNA-binding transcriptional regulator YiaG
MQGALPSMLLFREGEIRAASAAVSGLWFALSTREPESVKPILTKPRDPEKISATVLGAVAKVQKILAKHRDERELEELAQVFPLVVFEEAASAGKATSGRDILRRMSACLGLSFENVGRILNVPGETVRRWERGISRIPSDALATLEIVDSALTRLTRLFLPQRLPEVLRRKAELFDGSRALDWILQGRIADVVDRYEQALRYQG